MSVPKSARHFSVAFVDVSENTKRRGQKKRKKKSRLVVSPGDSTWLEKGRRNGAVDLQPDVTKARKICLAFLGELEQ